MYSNKITDFDHNYYELSKIYSSEAMWINYNNKSKKVWVKINGIQYLNH